MGQYVKQPFCMSHSHFAASGRKIMFSKGDLQHPLKKRKEEDKVPSNYWSTIWNAWYSQLIAQEHHVAELLWFKFKHKKNGIFLHWMSFLATQAENRKLTSSMHKCLVKWNVLRRQRGTSLKWGMPGLGTSFSTVAAITSSMKGLVGRKVAPGIDCDCQKAWSSLQNCAEDFFCETRLTLFNFSHY